MYIYYLILPGAKRAFAEHRTYDVLTKGRRVTQAGRIYKVRKVKSSFVTVKEVANV